MTSSELFYEMETELLKNLVRYLSKGSVGSAQWQLDKLHDMGKLKSVNANTIAKYSREAIKEAEREIQRATIRGASVIDKASEGHTDKLNMAVPANADERILKTAQSWSNIAANGLNRVGTSLLNKSVAMYQQGIDSASRAVAEQVTGAITGRQAIAQMCTEWSRTGIGALVDKSGRTWTPEAYAQTLVRTNMRNATTESQLERMDELDEDLIEVSSHAGARPLCAPYQGHVYSRTGKSTQYPSLDSTSYGEPAGLFGINCGHVMYPYFPGTKQTYKPTDDESQNAEDYKRSQKQRQIERSIRSAKRELELQKINGDTAAVSRAQERVSNRQEAMRNFIDESGRTRHYDREQIY